MIKNYIKHCINFCEPIIRQFIQEGPLILNYHSIGQSSDQFSVTVEQFESHVNLIKQSDYSVYNLTDLIANDFPEDAVVFTFDDGYNSHFTEAKKVLEEKNYEGVFFIITEWINESDYLTDEQVIRLSRNHEIGAHTKSHPDLSELNHSDLRAEILVHKQNLESLIGSSVQHFAFPFGQENNISYRAIKTVTEAGYDSICSTTGELPGKIQIFDSAPTLIERTPVHHRNPIEFLKLLSGKGLAIEFFDQNFVNKKSRVDFINKFRAI